VPLRRYVATVRLKRVTDGDRTFWHWESTFDTPVGRERELADMVGSGVYEAGFAGLRRYLSENRRASGPMPRPMGGTMTGQAVVLAGFGGPDRLRLETVEVPPPGPGEVRLRQSFVGVNFIDILIRRGSFPMVTPPAPIGMEAAGTVLDVGEGVHQMMPGDRVAYAHSVPGAYATLRTLPADRVVAFPEAIAPETAAALLFKGMTAEYLLHRVHQVKAGDWILVHAAAGGVGLLLCQWARQPRRPRDRHRLD
jgi:hypothetical protein